VSPRIALVAPTGPAARDILVEGESGILACSPPDDRPQWEPSKRKLTWPNGAVGFTYSGEEPDRLRGPQHFDAWLDEPAHMPLIEDVWSNLLFGMRGGKAPRIACTTTPIPSKWMKKLIADPFTVSVAVSTYANIQNLPEHFAKMILERYEGTRLGRQEIHGEILSDVEGALWDWTMIEKAGIEPADAPVAYDRIVIAVDPAGTSHNKSDETGIIVLGSADGNFYVLDDRSGRFKPNVWANRVTSAYEEYDADVIVAEDNYGGEMVESTIEAASDSAVKPRIKRVNSRRGKIIRADPVVALYERNRVFHVGMFNDLEDQLTTWVPGSTSPDRLDALVHGIHELSQTVAPSAVADPTRLRIMRPYLRRVVS
ncbi:MAG TPA: terminase family protein, partial [Actinomycetes bacterium]|nr:terminase family protein [Actinomycetes bacterium]